MPISKVVWEGGHKSLPDIFFYGGGGGVRLRLLRYPRIPLYMGGKPQKLNRQKFISLESSLHELFKNTTFRHLRGMGKTLSCREFTMMRFVLVVQ